MVSAVGRWRVEMAFRSLPPHIFEVFDDAANPPVSANMYWHSDAFLLSFEQRFKEGDLADIVSYSLGLIVLTLFGLNP